MKFPGREVFFSRDDLVITKTDLKGKITYANHTFLDASGYDESEVVGKPHNLIRNPNMPRAIYELLWKTITAGNEMFAYIANSTKSHDHYWVIGHVTPSIEKENIVGFHSTRRVPNPQTIKSVIEPLYDQLLSIEEKGANRKDGIQDSVTALTGILSDKGVSYDAFIADLAKDD